MESKVTLKYVLSILTLITLAKDTSSQNQPGVQIPIDPIVIKTVAQHYENPTIDQYEHCTHSRRDCIANCVDSRCRDKCPICPILIDQDVLVQGINDTLYRLPITTSKVNQTNIIRLTNEIRNIIRTSLGNITTQSQNNITIYQKTSKTGGKFGLGFNDKGPCCYIIEAQRCKSSPTGPVCMPRHQQTCGPHCISRVMRAKRVVTCNETQPDDCTQSIEYLPQPRRPGCQYTSKWPFIHCGSQTRIQHASYRRRSTCAQCYEIPYMNVMRGQFPRNCLGCFRQTVNRRPALPINSYYSSYGQQMPVLSYQSYQPYQPYLLPPPPPRVYDYNNVNSWAINADDSFDMPAQDNGFEIEERKCLNEDGTTIENCTEDQGPRRLSLETNLLDENGEHEYVDEIEDH